MGLGAKRRPSGRGGLWQGRLGRDELRGWSGRKGTGHSGARAAWVLSAGRRETERNGTGQDGAQRNKAGGASGTGGVGQTASGRGEAAT